MPVRRAREFIRRTKAEDDFMRRAVVVDIFFVVVVVGGGAGCGCDCGCGCGCLILEWSEWSVTYGRGEKNDEKVKWYYVCIYVLQWEDSEISVGTCLYLCCCEYDLQPELSSRLMIRKLISVQG